MKLNTLLAAALLIVTGCTSIRQDAKETSTNGVIRTVSMRITTTGDAKAVVEKLNVSNGKTQYLGAKGVEESSTTTNVNAIVEAVVSAAVKAAVKP